MIKDEFLKRVADAHRRWSLKYGDTIQAAPGDADPHDGEKTDIYLWNADVAAPPKADAELNAELASLIEQYRGA